MRAVFKKEFKGYFLSPVGYIFVGVFMLLASMFFLNGCITYQTADMSVVFSNMNVVCMFLVSVLTMKSFSEERNKKTDLLLLTSPRGVFEIVLGKYLAAIGVLMVAVLISLCFPAVLVMFGNPSKAEIFGSYLGFVLLWSSFASIGIFISSLTESQVISAVFTFGTLILFYFLDGIAAGVGNKFIAGILSWISLMRRYNEFQMGILNFCSVFYYISFIFVFLYLTVCFIEKRKKA